MDKSLIPLIFWASGGIIGIIGFFIDNFAIYSLGWIILILAGVLDYILKPPKKEKL